MLQTLKDVVEQSGTPFVEAELTESLHWIVDVLR